MCYYSYDYTVNPLQVKDNVCYKTLGHAYFIEDGGEKDTMFDGNLAASVKTGELIPSDKLVFLLYCFYVNVNNECCESES